MYFITAPTPHVDIKNASHHFNITYTTNNSNNNKLFIRTYQYGLIVHISYKS